MTTALLPQTTNHKRIIVITLISLLVHGVGFAYFWATPIFQFSSIPPQTISVELTSPSPSKETNSFKTSTTTEVKNTSQNHHTLTQRSSVEQSVKPNLATQPALKVKPEPSTITKSTDVLNQPAPIKQIADNVPVNSNNMARKLNTATTAETTPETKKASPPSPNIVVKTYATPLKTMKNNLSIELHRQVARKYPLIARKRGWQGNVKLGFFITPSGRIENIHIIDSSGVKVLDKSAIRSLSQVKTMTSALPTSGLDMDLTVEYRLQDR